MLSKIFMLSIISNAKTYILIIYNSPKALNEMYTTPNIFSRFPNPWIVTRFGLVRFRQIQKPSLTRPFKNVQ